MPPRSLPGLYYDEERNRYFPITRGGPSIISQQASSSVVAAQRSLRADFGAASRGTGTSQLDQRTQANVYRPKPSRRGKMKLRRDLQGMSRYTDRLQRLHEEQMVGISNLSLKGDSKAPFDFLGTDLTCLAIEDGRMFLGDKAGMLYLTSTIDPDGSWATHHHLGSQVSSVHFHNGTMYAASFGPKPSIFISTDEYMSSLNMHSFHDMWTVHWVDPEPSTRDPNTSNSPSAVIGMKQRAVYMPSLETHRGSYIMPTNSDVFAVYKHRSQVFTGARNGSVKLFDVRIPVTSHATLFQPCVRTSRNPGRWDSLAPNSTLNTGKTYSLHPASSYPSASEGHTGSVTNLQIVNEWGLLLAAMDGTLAMYDLRFLASATLSNKSWTNTRPVPARTFSGHTNRLTQGLGFCVDPSSNFVLAAGSDKRIRAWSLRTGEAIFPLESQDQQGTPGTNLASTADTSTARSTTETRNRSRDTLLHKAFNNPVTAIVLSDSRSSFEWGGVASSPNDTNKRQEQDSRASMLREIWVTAGRDVYCFSGSLALT